MFYKFTGQNGRVSPAREPFDWPLPSKNADGTWTPGEWTPEIVGALEPCSNGYHFTDDKWCAAWIDAEMYEIEVSGDYINSADTPTKKYVCRKARLVRKIEAWNERTARLFAVRCARDAMSRIENPDPRSLAALDVAERYTNGEATDEELAAARDAARDAAWDAARAAAWDAAWAAAWDAAWAAARAAAWAAAWDAAWAAAWDAARAAAWAAALQKYSGWLLDAVGEKG